MITLIITYFILKAVGNDGDKFVSARNVCILLVLIFNFRKTLELNIKILDIFAYINIGILIILELYRIIKYKQIL